MELTRDLIRHWLVLAEQHRTSGHRTSEHRLDYMADILFRRYVAEPPETLVAIAESRGMSGASAQQAQDRALRRLRNPAVLSIIEQSGVSSPSLQRALGQSASEPT